MSTPVPDDYEVRDAADHLEVTGLSAVELRLAIQLYRAVESSQAESRSALYSRSLAMLEADIPLNPRSAQRQIQRGTALRAELLENSGYETYESLAASRQTLQSSVRTWVSRLRERGDLFTVKFKGTTLIPAVQLTDSGDLDEAVADMVRPLLASGLDSWSLWSWLRNPTGLLSSDVPVDVARQNPGRARKAAEREAAEVRLASSNIT